MERNVAGINRTLKHVECSMRSHRVVPTASGRARHLTHLRVRPAGTRWRVGWGQMHIISACAYAHGSVVYCAQPTTEAAGVLAGPTPATVGAWRTGSHLRA